MDLRGALTALGLTSAEDLLDVVALVPVGKDGVIHAEPECSGTRDVTRATARRFLEAGCATCLAGPPEVAWSQAELLAAAVEVVLEAYEARQGTSGLSARELLQELARAREALRRTGKGPSRDGLTALRQEAWGPWVRALEAEIRTGRIREEALEDQRRALGLSGAVLDGTPTWVAYWGPNWLGPELALLVEAHRCVLEPDRTRRGDVVEVPLWVAPVLAAGVWSEGGSSEVVLARSPAVLETALALWDRTALTQLRTLAGAVSAAVALEE